MAKLNHQQMVADLMVVSEHGVLAEAFVVEAIRFYSKTVSEHEITAREREFGVINPDVWKAIADDNLKRLEANFEQQDPEAGTKDTVVVGDSVSISISGP